MSTTNNTLQNSNPLTIHEFIANQPSYTLEEKQLFGKIEYFHLGTGVLFRGILHKQKMKALVDIARNKSIPSTYNQLFAVFDRDKTEYVTGQEIVLSEPMYASPEVNSVRNSLSTQGSSFFVIDGEINVLPIPLSATNYEPTVLLNRGTRFKVSSVEVVDWNEPTARISCVNYHHGLRLVHLVTE